ncbi:hypothetical protein GGF42_006002 [Coemansia sp. RSA 2424]|nr:hypothetical protein GGF42_006002 [Coemansia sp. RSA 2424]
MADTLTVIEKSGDYIATYTVESKIDNEKEFIEALKENLPVLIKGHVVNVLSNSFEQDCIQYLGERVYQFSGLGQKQGDGNGWGCLIRMTQY